MPVSNARIVEFSSRVSVSAGILLSFAGVLYLWFVATAEWPFPCNALHCPSFPPPPTLYDVLWLDGAQILGILTLVPIAVVASRRLWSIGVLAGTGLDVALYWYVYAHPANVPILPDMAYTLGTLAILAGGWIILGGSILLALSDFWAARMARTLSIQI
jgi:hypothetical protein